MRAKRSASALLTRKWTGFNVRIRGHRTCGPNAKQPDRQVCKGGSGNGAVVGRQVLSLNLLIASRPIKLEGGCYAKDDVRP